MVNHTLIPKTCRIRKQDHQQNVSSSHASSIILCKADVVCMRTSRDFSQKIDMHMEPGQFRSAFTRYKNTMEDERGKKD